MNRNPIWDISETKSVPDGALFFVGAQGFARGPPVVHRVAARLAVSNVEPCRGV